MSRLPLVLLLATLVIVAVLGLIGLGVERHLDPTSLSIAGTSSSRGEALARENFGESVPFAVMLRGPAAAIDRQGPRLVAALRRDRAATTISPWEHSASAALRPGPDRALILVDYHLPLATAIRDTVPALERTLAARIHRPVTATQSGFATISRALQKESLSASERAELLAAPLLIIVLLLVFRSLVAAAIPLLLGAMTVLAGRGVLVFLSSFMRIDALSLVVCTMMGLALGVDYSLLIVSRFREELAAGRSPAAAALRADAPPDAPLSSPDPPSSSRSLPPRFSSRARCSSRSPPLSSSSPRSASSSPGVRYPACLPCSAPASTPGASAALPPPRARRARGRPLRRPRLCAARPLPLWRSRSPWRSLPFPRSPSTQDHRGSTSSPLRAPRAKTPKRSKRPSAPAGRRPSSWLPPLREARSPRRTASISWHVGNAALPPNRV